MPKNYSKRTALEKLAETLEKNEKQRLTNVSLRNMDQDRRLKNKIQGKNGKVDFEL
jgi:hypothetical protein